MLAVLLASVTLHAYAGTPQAAATQAVSFGLKKAPVVRRINVVGRYAVVLTSGGMMEGSEVTESILVEQFSFGWQPLDVLNFSCRLTSHALGEHVNAMLMRGMPQMTPEKGCDTPHDAGPQSHVEAVRKMMRGPLVPYVIVSRNWAMGEWYGAGGGERLFKSINGVWHQVAGGGGAMNLNIVRAFGVPYDEACKFHIYDAKCR